MAGYEVKDGMWNGMTTVARNALTGLHAGQLVYTTDATPVGWYRWDGVSTWVLLIPVFGQNFQKQESLAQQDNTTTTFSTGLTLTTPSLALGDYVLDWSCDMQYSNLLGGAAQARMVVNGNTGTPASYYSRQPLLASDRDLLSAQVFLTAVSGVQTFALQYARLGGLSGTASMFNARAKFYRTA